MLVVIMILKDAATFQVLSTVSLFCAWNITTEEINSGVHLLKSCPPPQSAFVYFRWSWTFYFGLGLGLVSSGLGLGLVTLVLVLVLRIWSCLHHWAQGP